MAKTKIEPIDGESIRHWVDRYYESMGKLPKRRTMVLYNDRFIPVQIKSESGIDSIQQSLQIQEALLLLMTIFPQQVEFYWDGTTVFWFGDNLDAITFKLHLSTI